MVRSLYGCLYNSLCGQTLCFFSLSTFLGDVYEDSADTHDDLGRGLGHPRFHEIIMRVRLGPLPLKLGPICDFLQIPGGALLQNWAAPASETGGRDWY